MASPSRRRTRRATGSRRAPRASRARISVSRRLYFFALEIDLTGLWSLPRRRRYSALLAGMAFDAIVLFALLLARFGDEAGWWPLGDPVTRLCAALTFVQLFAIASQFFVFARTDVYAVLITATGCVNLFRVNQLLARRALRRLSSEQERELAEAHPRDLAIGRWFRWLYLLGLAAAAWFFVAYFAPATITLVLWIARTIGQAELGSVHFAEAVLVRGADAFDARLRSPLRSATCLAGGRRAGLAS